MSATCPSLAGHVPSTPLAGAAAVPNASVGVAVFAWQDTTWQGSVSPPLFAVTGVSYSAFAAWRWGIAPAGTTSVEIGTALPQLYMTPDDIAAGVAAPLNPACIPGATLIRLAPPGNAVSPAASNCAPRVTAYVQACPSPFTTAPGPFLGEICSKEQIVSCNGELGAHNANLQCQNLDLIPQAALQNGAPDFQYAVQPSAVYQVADIKDPSTFGGNCAVLAEKGYHTVQCPSEPGALVAYTKGVQCEQTGWPSATAPATSPYSIAACTAGVPDAAGTYACAALRCNPIECHNVGSGAYKAAGGVSCVPYAKPDVDPLMAAACIGTAATRNFGQSEGYDVALPPPSSSSPGSSGSTGTTALFALSTVPMNGALNGPAPGAGNTCPCAGDIDGPACSAGTSGTAAGGASEGQVCREWCGGTLGNPGATVSCTTATQTYCAAHPNDAACACSTMESTAFPGATGQTYNEMRAMIKRASSDAAPAAIGQGACWWTPCLRSIHSDGGGSFLPIQATSSCPPTHEVCAINITNWSIAQAAYDKEPSGDTFRAVKNASVVLSQDCSICPPDPGQAGEGTPQSCSKTPSDTWYIQVYNLGNEVLTAALPGVDAVRVNPGETLPIPISGTYVVPGAAASLSVSVPGFMTGGKAYTPVFPLVETQVPRAVLDSVTRQVTFAVWGTSAYLVYGDTAPQYAADVNACLNTGNCPTGALPLPVGRGGAVVETSLRVYNFTSNPVTLCTATPCPAQATLVQPTPCTATGGCVPFTLSKLPLTSTGHIILNGAVGGLSATPLVFASTPSIQLKGNYVVATLQSTPTSPGEAVAVAFLTDDAAFAYATQLQGSTAGTLPAPTPPTGGGGTTTGFTVSALNYANLPVGLALGAATQPVVPGTPLTLTVPYLTQLTLGGVLFTIPQDTTSVVASSSVSTGAFGAGLAVATLGQRVYLAVYPLQSQAQSYADAVQGTLTLLAPPPPSSVPVSPSTGSESTPAWVWVLIVLGILLVLLGGGYGIYKATKRRTRRPAS